MVDITDAEHERNQMRALIEAATAGAPTPPTTAFLRARLDEVGRVDSPSTARPRRLVTGGIAAVFVLLVGAGVAVALRSGGSRSTDIATDSGPPTSVGTGEIVFNCFELVTETVFDEDGNDLGEAESDLQRSCLATADRSMITILNEDPMSRVHGPVPSPDGRLLAVSPLEGDERIVGIDSGGIVATFQGRGRPAWLSDGSGLVTDRLEGGMFELVVVGLDGTVVERYGIDEDILPGGAEAGWFLWPPVPSSDGQTIAVLARFESRLPDNGSTDWNDRIIIVDRSDGSVDTLIETDGPADLTWAPDGGLDVSQGQAIVRHDLTTGATTTVFDGAEEQLLGHSYSPDGGTLAMVDGTTIRLLDLATGRLQSIGGADAVFASNAPDWSIDGRQLLVGAIVAADEQDDFHARIAVIEAETGEFEMLMVDGEPVDGTYPSWRR